jgi:glycosyltransferase involved in cell wall biosynthesis
MEKIEFVIPTYNRPYHLMCTINSIFAQRNDKWKIHVIADNPPVGTLDKIIDFFKNDERIKFTILPERYNDWGHTPRNVGVKQCSEEWVIMTGEDNYYTPVFVDHFLSDVTKNTHFVYCDMIHNWTNFQYHHIRCHPSWGQIDIGNFMTRTKFAQQLSLDVTNEQADGKFVEEYLQKFPSGHVIHIPKPLYVHN